MKHFAQSKNWADAETACIANGGHLATIESQEQHDWAHAISAQTRQHVWIGATDQFSEGAWTDATGQSAIPYSNWQGGEPNGGTGESCAASVYTWGDGIMANNGKWNDAPCSFTYHFVCGLGSGKKRHI